MNEKTDPPRRKAIRWWPAAWVACIAAVAIIFVRTKQDLAFQQRNLTTLSITLGAALCLLLWWLLFSRAPGRARLLSLGALVLLAVVARSALRFHGFTGDMVPIIETRWAGARNFPETGRPQAASASRLPGDFSQFLGPNRSGVLNGPALDTNWTANPPRELWRAPVGAAWSGFSVVGNRAVTLEQFDENEVVVCRNLFTGADLWRTTNAGRYATPVAGEGPRTTPTIVGDRVYAFGAAGWLQCLDIATGKPFWKTNVLEIAGASVPAWGFAGSPLVQDGRVFVSAGGKDGRSLLIFDAATGRLTGSGGSSPANYGSPFFATLAGVPQVIIFNEQDIAAHNPVSGEVLWQRPWGLKYPLVAMPVQTGPDSIFISAGYGVGAELVKIAKDPSGKLTPETVWASKRMKAKFANPVMRDGFVYGLDDGILACVDLKDGSQRWKEGRYGHGQGLLIGDLFLLMAESGELILLKPTPDSSGELGRHRIFEAKTWNPICLAGDLLLVRTDREAACFRLAISR